MINAKTFFRQLVRILNMNLWMLPMSQIGKKLDNVIDGVDFRTRAMEEVITELGIFALWWNSCIASQMSPPTMSQFALKNYALKSFGPRLFLELQEHIALLISSTENGPMSVAFFDCSICLK